MDKKNKKYDIKSIDNHPAVLYGVMQPENLDLKEDAEDESKYDIDHISNLEVEELYGSPDPIRQRRHSKYDIDPWLNEGVCLYGSPDQFRIKRYSWDEKFYGNTDLLKSKVVVILGSNALNIKKHGIVFNKNCTNCSGFNKCCSKWSDFIEDVDWLKLNKLWQQGYTLLWIQPTDRLLKDIMSRFNERCIFYYSLESLIPEELKNTSNYCAYWLELILTHRNIESNADLCPYEGCGIKAIDRELFALSKPDWYITFVDKHQLWAKTLTNKFMPLLNNSNKII